MKTLFVLVLVIFVDGVPADGRVGGPFDNKAACEAKRGESFAKMKEAEVDGVLVCVEIKYKRAVILKRERDL